MKITYSLETFLDLRFRLLIVESFVYRGIQLYQEDFSERNICRCLTEKHVSVPASTGGVVQGSALLLLDSVFSGPAKSRIVLHAK